ncbi:MAG: hypothetical protein H7X97_03625, partial [Opitutaceae bacterium]|nr:hypothetical protein [Verrucomicrobiales bacterium]
MKLSLSNLGRSSRWFPRMWFAGILMLHLLLVGRGLALDPTKDLSQYNCQTWSRQSGLPVRSINAIAQTRDGYLWLGTSVGLVRFDGIAFKQLDLHTIAEVRNTVVKSLASSRSGGLWVGLELSAFGFYDGTKFSFRGEKNSKTPPLNVRTILEGKDGTVWLAAEQQAARLNSSGEVEAVLNLDPATNLNLNVICAYEDPQGRLWFGTASQGLYRWQDGVATKLPDPELDKNIILCVAEDGDGNIWVGTNSGLICYDSNFQRRPIPPLWEEIHALLVDRQGVLWIGAREGGLVRYQKGAYQHILNSAGQAGEFVTALFEDHEGSLWVGTGDGLSQISDVKFPIQAGSEDPKFKNVFAVSASPRGGVWIASNRGGVTRFDPKTKTYETQFMPTPLVKRAFEASNGDLYVVNDTRNLVVFSGGKSVAAYPASNMVVGMTENKEGVVVSVGGDLHRAGTNYFQPYLFNNGEKPPFYWIYNLTSGRDGAIWVSSVNGIFRVKDGTYRHWSAAEGLVDPVVEWICEDLDGVVWAAQQSGIARLKDGKIRLINREGGLFDNNIYSIVPDDLGNLWVDSARGIFSVTRQSMNDFCDGKTNRVECTIYDGAESVKVADKTSQEHVGCKTADGLVWFPGPRGVVMIDPAHIPINRVAPPVHVDRIRASGKEVARANRVIVPPDKGELEFHYNALSFIAPHKAQFRYRLEGYDKDWVEAGDRRIASYTNLKPGRYTFQVIAANSDGIWNKQGDQLEIQLLPHFYQTVWFYLLCGGLLCALPIGTYGWRVRHLKHNQLLLQAQVRNRTAELAETNTSLRHEIEERNRMQLEIEQIHKQLLETSRQAGMSEVATSVLHNVGNVLNSVNVSCAVVAAKVRRSRIGSVAKTAVLLHQHEHDLAEFLTLDPTGRKLPDFLAKLATRLAEEQAEMLKELKLLGKNIDHIKDIVAMQQNYAKVSGITETVNLSDLIDDSLRMNEGSLMRHDVVVTREYAKVPPITLEKHKALQILVNLIRNAKHACDDSDRKDHRITIRVTQN